MKDDLVEQIARAMNPILFGGLPDGECGPATAAARQEARNKAHAAYEVARPAILEEAAKVADKYPERDPAEDGNGYWAAEEIASAIRALAHATGREPAPTCPICAEPFKADDICAADINEGTCHAECLEGSPVVYLDTGEPSDGPIDTFTYGQEGG